MSRGQTRLLQDRGLRLALLAGGAVVGLMALQNQFHDRDRLRVNRTPALTGRVWCGGRTADGASVTLRPVLSKPPERVGVPYSTFTTDKTGQFAVTLPFPTPPDFKGELVVAAAGCFSVRLPVLASTPPMTITLTDVTYVPPPVDIGDGRAASGFPPEVSSERTAAARRNGVQSGEYALFDGPPPTCSQCHASIAGEHHTVHGAPPSAPLIKLAATADALEAQQCTRCHAPVMALTTTSALHPVPQDSAFSCRVCHSFRPDGHLAAEGGMGQGGAFAIPPGDTRRFARGTRPDTASPAMAVERNARLSSAAVCAQCHSQSVLGPSGRVLTDPTAEEFTQWQKAEPTRHTTSCVTCHFSPTTDPFLVDGYARQLWGVARPDAPRRSHTRVGHPADSVKLTATWEGPATLVVTAHNTGAGHAVPGVAPWEGWEVVVHSDAHPTEGPMLPDRSAGVTLARIFSGAGGTCALPWEATSVHADSRLMPGTPVKWTWRFDHRQAVKVVLRRHSPCSERAASQGVAMEETTLRILELTP